MFKLWKDEEGLTTVEYALLLALVVVAGIVAWQGLGGTVQDVVERSDDEIAGTAGIETTEG
jgi:Flp pilus assembly pilin Flp